MTTETTDGANRYPDILPTTDGVLSPVSARAAILKPKEGNKKAVSASEFARRQLDAAVKLGEISTIASVTEADFIRNAKKLGDAKGLGHLIHARPAHMRQLGLSREGILQYGADEIKAAVAAEIFVTEADRVIDGDDIAEQFVALTDKLFHLDHPQTRADEVVQIDGIDDKVTQATALMRSMAGFYLPEYDQYGPETMRMRIEDLFNGRLNNKQLDETLTPDEFFALWNAGIMALGSTFGERNKSVRLSQVINPLMHTHGFRPVLLDTPLMYPREALSNVGNMAIPVRDSDVSEVVTGQERAAVTAAKYQDMAGSAVRASIGHLNSFAARDVQNLNFLREKHPGQQIIPPGSPLGVVSFIETLL